MVDEPVAALWCEINATGRETKYRTIVPRALLDNTLTERRCHQGLYGTDPSSRKAYSQTGTLILVPHDQRSFSPGMLRT